MPILETDVPFEQLKKLAETNKCKDCGSDLTLCWGGAYGYDCHIVRCTKDVKHEGLEREAYLSPYDIQGFNLYPNLDKGRKKMVSEQFGKDVGTKLAKYHGVLSLTKPQAEEILLAIYGDAPKAEITRAVLLCASFQLNPLMKHVFLIPFNKGTPKESWATVIGIKAKRLLASRRGSYSYVDNTPRIMTGEEQKAIFGQADTDRIWVITKVKDPKTGAEAPGYGFWMNKDTCYGTDKGNTPFNMAAIRSESQALDRLRPGEMPVGVEVVPEEAIEGDWKEVPGKEGEEIKVKPEVEERTSPTPEELEKPGLATHELEPKDEIPVTEDDLAQLNKLMAEGHVSAEQLGTYIKKDKGWAEVKTLPDLKKWQFHEIIAAVKKGKE